MSIDFRPRSSVWKTGMVLSNSVGTIDEDYHSEVSAVFYHVMPNMPKYEVGDKIGQIKIGITHQIDFEIVDEIKYTGRGGYGSTGLKAQQDEYTQKMYNMWERISSTALQRKDRKVLQQRMC